MLYDASGQVESTARVNTGHGKVTVLDSLQDVAGVIYVGGSTSDVHAMLYVNARRGLTNAASEDTSVAHIAQRRVLSDDALSLLIPILRDVIGWDTKRIFAYLEARSDTTYEREQVWTAPLSPTALLSLLWRKKRELCCRCCCHFCFRFQCRRLAPKDVKRIVDVFHAAIPSSSKSCDIVPRSAW